MARLKVRRDIIREWMSLARQKRQSSEQVCVVRQFETDQAFCEGRLWLIWGLSLSGLQSMLQATVCDVSRLIRSRSARISLSQPK